MTTELEETCAGCDDSDESHDLCGYVNDDCPEGCSTEHPMPTPGDDGSWECPETGTTYLYCHYCEWEERSYYDRYRTSYYVNGEWLCDPHDHGYYNCCECGEWTDEVYYDRYDDTYCSNCYRESGGSGSEGETRRLCGDCGTYNDYLDEYSERFLCKCEADELVQRRVPVTVAA